MRSRVVAVGELNDAEVRAWRDLALHAVEPNPLFEADCLIPAATHLAGGSQIYLVIAEEDGRFYGCFPAAELRGGIPPQFKLRFLSRPTVTTLVRRLRYDGTPLLRADRSVETAKALLTAIKEPTALGDRKFLVLESMDTEGPVAASFHQALAELGMSAHVLRSWTRPVIRRDEEDDRDFATSNRKKLAKLEHRLSEESHASVRVVDVSDDPFMIEHLITMEAAGYKSHKDVAMSAHPGEPEWFRDMCDRFRQEGRLLVYALAVGDDVIALQLMIRAGDCLFGLQSVYDETYARFSPGIILHRSFLERFFTSIDVRMKDTCTFEGNSTLERLYPHSRPVETLVVVVGGPLDHLLLRVFSLAQRALGADSALGRKAPKLHSAFQRIAGRMGLRVR